jgi:hypothetical protein
MPCSGRTYRLRGSVTQRERVLFTGTNKDHARTKAGRQNDTALISIAAIIEPKVGGESAVLTIGGLDSSFAASTASTRRSGVWDGKKGGSSPGLSGGRVIEDCMSTCSVVRSLENANPKKTVHFASEDGETCQHASDSESMLGSAIQSPRGLGELWPDSEAMMGT